MTESSGAGPGSRSGAILPAAQVLPDPGLVVPIVPSMSVQLAVRARHDYPTCRQLLRRRGITPRIARRGIESTIRLGRHRWKVERSLAWLLANRRLTVRYERRADLLTALLDLACALVCARRLQLL